MCKGRGRQSLYCELMSGLQKGSMALAMLKETRTKICGVRWKFLEWNKEYGPRDREMLVQICAHHLLAVRVWKNYFTSQYLTLLICQVQVNEASLCICLRDSVKQRVWMVGVTPSPSPPCWVTAHWAGLSAALPVFPVRCWKGASGTLPLFLPSPPEGSQCDGQAPNSH